MADNVTITSGANSTPPDGTVVSTDDAGASGQIQRVKLAVSADGSATHIPADAAAGLKVDLGADNDVVVSGTVSVTEPVSVDDNAGSLTVDNPVLSVVGGGTEAAAQRVTLANDSTGLVSVDDNGGSLTVDGTVAVSSLPALVAGTANIGDVDVLTVPAPLSTTGGGTEATAHRVTIANDSTGVLSVDDNGASLTVDGTVSVSGAVDTELPAAVTLADATADPTVPGVGAFLMARNPNDGNWYRVNLLDGNVDAQNQFSRGVVSVNFNHVFNGTNWDRVRGDTTNGMDVDVTRVGGTVTTAGGAANGAPVSGNPNLVAGRASTAIPTDVGADGDAASIWTNRNGAPVQTQAPHVGLNSDPWNLVHEAAQYTTTQTSAVLVAGGASEKIVVTKVQIQVGGTTAGTLQLYFGTGAYVRGTNRAIFDGEFAPSATLKPGVIMDGPFIAGTNGDDLMVTTSAAINPLTISVWYYVVT